MLEPCYALYTTVSRPCCEQGPICSAILFHHRRLFPSHTRTHVAKEGPLYRTSILIAHPAQPPLSAKVCNRWLLTGIFRWGGFPGRVLQPYYTVLITVKELFLPRDLYSIRGRAVPDAGCGAESGWVSDIEI